MRPTLIFDLDGVILSERGYWRVADATVAGLAQELGLRQDAAGAGPAQGVIPLAAIDGLKSRGVNSNWDLTEAVLAAVLSLGCARQPLAAQQAIAAADWAAQKPLWRSAGWSGLALEGLFDAFWPALGDRSGHSVPSAWLAHLGGPIAALAARPAFRAAVHARFQEELAALAAPAETVVLRDELQQALCAARAAGFIVGIATGRPREEAIGALDHLGLTDCFDPAHVVTFDEVARAQRQLGGPPLGKPHPFCLLQAAHPDQSAAALCAAAFEQRPWLIYVGDAGSDLACAQAAGAQSWMVLTGCADPAAAEARRAQFLAQGATRVEQDALACLDALIGALT